MVLILSPGVSWATGAEALAERFTEVANSELREGRATLSREAAPSLRDFIKTGTTKLTEDEASVSQVNEAEAALRRFVKRLIEKGNQVGLEVKISASDFEHVKAGFCPFYPFC